jgi:hypothetical protein
MIFKKPDQNIDYSLTQNEADFFLISKNLVGFCNHKGGSYVLGVDPLN